mmetsp:Transcript_38711/g.96090  ORF Transcript_38711/g.96090 Transcript_38711/m.96090 type:complete len:248 (-) Transcript_38711:77-820(-)
MRVGLEGHCAGAQLRARVVQRRCVVDSPLDEAHVWRPRRANHGRLVTLRHDPPLAHRCDVLLAAAQEVLQRWLVEVLDPHGGVQTLVDTRLLADWQAVHVVGAELLLVCLGVGAASLAHGVGYVFAGDVGSVLFLYQPILPRREVPIRGLAVFVHNRVGYVHPRARLAQRVAPPQVVEELPHASVLIDQRVGLKLLHLRGDLLLGRRFGIRPRRVGAAPGQRGRRRRRGVGGVSVGRGSGHHLEAWA